MHSRYHLALASALAAQALGGGLNVPLPANNVFDYVIVGGGPAGLTVANRLSEDPNIQVLVLEAGTYDDYQEQVMIPVFSGAAGVGPNGACGGYNWCDETVPQTYLDGAPRQIPQGMGLGGGTLINAMLWNRGDQGDWNDWVSLGADGWGWSDILPYFERSETFTPEPSAAEAQLYGIGYNSSVHGTSGPQSVTFPNFLYNASVNFFSALNGMGIPTVPDPNTGTEKGAMYLPQGINFTNQSRADARVTRFDPASTRANLYVSTSEHVQRVLFEGGCTPAGNASAVAVGVEVAASPTDIPWTAVANREVILSAGAFRSPQLLELSGIGSASALAAGGIESRINLPGVGNNLQDHMIMHMTQTFNNDSVIYPNWLNNQTINNAAQALYYANRTGPWTFGVPDGNGFFATSQFSPRASELASMAQSQSADQYLAPGLDSTVIAGYSAMRPLLISALTDNSRSTIEFLQTNSGPTQISNMRPLTRGTVHINSSDAFDPPVINMRYGSNPVDYEVMMDALRWNDALFQTPEIQQLQPSQSAPVHNATDQQLQQFLNTSLGTEYHPSCSCAMLPLDYGGVVDTNLLVYGTSNLRVVDASIFPILPASHLEAVVYGVAEKASDIIIAAQSADPSPTTPTLPLDTAVCTTTAAAGKVRRSPEERARRHAERRQLPNKPPAGNAPIPHNVGYYPIQQSLIHPVPADAPKAASVGLPQGAALEFGNQLIDLANSLLGDVGGILGGLTGGLTDDQDSNVAARGVAKRFDA